MRMDTCNILQNANDLDLGLYMRLPGLRCRGVRRGRRKILRWASLQRRPQPSFFVKIWH